MLHKALSRRAGRGDASRICGADHPAPGGEALSGSDGRWRRRQTILRETFGAAMRTARAAHWGDSSNKLSWLIPDLAALFPEARFVHLVRDGRKVASSYFHKLGDECYDDRANAALQAFYDGRRSRRRRRKRHTGGRCRAAAIRMAADFRALRPVPAHRLALGRDQPGGAGRAGGLAARARTLFVRLEDLRDIASQVRELYEFWACLTATRLRRLRPAAQCQPAGRPTAGRPTRRASSRPSRAR